MTLTTTDTTGSGRAEAPKPTRPVRLRRPAIRWLSPALAVLIALGAAALLISPNPVKEEPVGNRALLDAEATTKVITDVGDTLTKIFTYTPETLAATEQSAQELLSGKAAEQYRQLFAQVRQQAPAQRLTLTTRVVRAGVSHLAVQDARLLVFLDQTTTRAGKPAGTAAAQLSVTARLTDGRWRITELKSS